MGRDVLKNEIESATERASRTQGTLAAYWLGMADGLRLAQRHTRNEEQRRALNQSLYAATNAGAPGPR
jgi:hypothetical protein